MLGFWFKSVCGIVRKQANKRYLSSVKFDEGHLGFGP